MFIVIYEYDRYSDQDKLLHAIVEGDENLFQSLWAEFKKEKMKDPHYVDTFAFRYNEPSYLICGEFLSFILARGFVKVEYKDFASCISIKPNRNHDKEAKA